MAVLLTGGAGYIGSHTAVELIDSGYEVVILDNLSNSSPKAVDRIEDITDCRPAFYEADARCPEAISRAFDEHRIEGVIHFAGLKCVPESIEKPLAYYRNNIDSALSVLESMSSHPEVHSFVFSSSATVYGDNEVPFVESMEKRAQTNPYGSTKSFIEDIARDFALSHPDRCVVSLRYFNPIGAHESGLIGEDPRGVPNNLMPFIQQVAIGKRERLIVYGNDFDTPDGTGIRDYIHVTDLARGHVAALGFASDHVGDWKVNLGSGNGTSVLSMVDAFERATGVDLPYEISDRRPGDVDEMVADPSLAEALFGWRAERTIEDACRDAWRWQSGNPEGYGE